MLLQAHRSSLNSTVVFNSFPPKAILPPRGMLRLRLAMGNIINLSVSKKKKRPFPVEAAFNLPSPLPSWPAGGEFAKGRIDLGGLDVCQVSTFTQVWATKEGGPDGLGATFFKPSSIPDGFSAFGYYAQANNKPLFGWVLAGRNTGEGNALAKPVDYSLVWSSESSGVRKDGNGYFWLPTPPEGYRAVGLVVTGSPEKPSVEEVRCVRSDLTDESENDESIWSTDGFGVNGVRPVSRGSKALGVMAGTFSAQASGAASGSPALACLKNAASNLAAMPNLAQVEALMEAYSPWIYFHPDEEYLPSSVNWFFGNGALLYQKGNQNPTAIDAEGANLPQGGSNDGEYWIDLPADDGQREKLKKGDISSTKLYLHIKPMLGGTFTDVAMWIFYPFNGPGKAKVQLINIKLGKIGKHVGDWEHMTLRISNLTGELWKVYFSEHSGGVWVEASQLEFAAAGGNKPVGYSSLHGHAMYAKPGLVLQGKAKLGIGIRNDTAKGSGIDTGKSFEVVAAEHMALAEPPWLSYRREWGPKISYNIAGELKSVERFLPGKLKKTFESIIRSLPDELLGEEGPTGPKEKSSWENDEKTQS